MAAPKGNNYNKKWKTQKERQEAFALVYEHLSSGYSKGSFPHADWDTVEAYAQEFPEDFPAEKLKEAERLGYFEWEKIGVDGTRGKIPNYNATSWIFNMKNRFNWHDRQETKHSGEIKTINDDRMANAMDILARLGKNATNKND